MFFVYLQHFRFGARVSNNLYCYNSYIKHAYHPYKVELISESPLILLYHNFTSETESNHLVKHVLPNVSGSFNYLGAGIGVPSYQLTTENALCFLLLLSIADTDIKLIEYRHSPAKNQCDLTPSICGPPNEEC